MGVTTGTGEQAVPQEEAVSGTHRTEVRSQAGERGLGQPPCFQDHSHQCSVLSISKHPHLRAGQELTLMTEHCAHRLSSSVRCGVGLAGLQLPLVTLFVHHSPREGRASMSRAGHSLLPLAKTSRASGDQRALLEVGWGESLSVSDGTPPATYQENSGKASPCP